MTSTASCMLLSGKPDVQYSKAAARHIYMTGLAGRAGSIWELAADGSRERPVTDLRGRRGYLESLSLATDGRYLYFHVGQGSERHLGDGCREGVDLGSGVWCRARADWPRRV